MRVVLHFVAGLVATLMLQSATLADDLQVSGLHMHWPDGFTLASQPDALPMKLVGKGGETVLVTVMRRDTPYPPEQRESGLKMHEDFAQHQLAALATRKGDLALPLERTALDDGEILYSTGTHTKPGGFYLQFFLISRPEVVALITIDGTGDVASEMKRFRPLFASVSWDK